MADNLDDLIQHFNNMDRRHDKLSEEFERLRIEPSAKVPRVGDRVVFAAGLLGMGHAWARMEADVVEVGETSVRIMAKDDLLHQLRPMWISPVLITDVLGGKVES